MPPLNFIKPLGHAIFLAQGLKVPINFDETYYRDHNPIQGEMAHPPQQIPPLFMSPHPSFKWQQNSADTIGQNFQDFHDTILDAIGYAHNMWKLQAKVQNLQVMSLTAIGSPGCVDGPELESLIKQAPMVASWSGNMGKHRDAVAKGVSKCYKDWQGQIMVPGLPWYPAFIAFPGPMAPPMPNIPMPLIMCPSGMMAEVITPSQLKTEMGNALDGGLKQDDPTKQYEALHLAIATVFSLAMTLWMLSQQIMLVLGKGPIPSFAPPFVPVGPVVGGDNIAAPGHFMA